MTRLYLIDGTALAYRSFYAFASSPRGGLSTKAGTPTGAVYGFVQTLRALIDREHPELLVVSFDGARQALDATKLYAEYKSTRAKMPDDLVPQLRSGSYSRSIGNSWLGGRVSVKRRRHKRKTQAPLTPPGCPFDGRTPRDWLLTSRMPGG